MNLRKEIYANKNTVIHVSCQPQTIATPVTLNNPSSSIIVEVVTNSNHIGAIENNIQQQVMKPVDKFYSEQEIILPQYKHVKTPKVIQEYLLDLNKINSEKLNLLGSAERFCVQSKSFAGCQLLTALNVPFRLNNPTFDDMITQHKEWYFYWRMQVLSGNYPDCPLNYIIVFIYELLNYTFNEKAAFNLSMLHQIYYGYIKRKQYLNHDLSNWISDFCSELGEKELEMEWKLKDRNYFNSTYDNIVNNIDQLDKLTMSFWKSTVFYFPTNSEFFKSNKNLIYKVFRSSLPILASAYKAEGKNLLEEWFRENTHGRASQPLYIRAVIGRHVPERKIVYHETTAKMKSTFRNLFRLSENIARGIYGEKRLLEIDIEYFPKGLIEELTKYFTADPKFKAINGRVVKGKDKTSCGRGSAIPEQLQDSEPMPPAPEIEFDIGKIHELSRESEELIEIFADRYYEEENEDGLEKHCRPDCLNFSDVCGNAIEEDVEGFITELNELERYFLLGFEDQERDVKESTRYLKSKGNMLGVFISNLNEKALKLLGDNIVEHEGTVLIISEEYKSVVDGIRRGSLNG